ncbi:MAG TPA: NAD(P)/FAD-dependent oxidoreductase [Pyrinomonadaceae bacterium]|jgi:phytoene dehydrogenase-like protein|nr:NAD(P)/FAD-dependent oxidoreductase [Pyrinomonadaceae bacterium]
MQSEVIVVGAGIGGLTVAALLAARGVDVCLFERQSHVGGCVANFEHLGYSFDPTFGLYSDWGNGGAWQNVFANLSVPPPEVGPLSPNFIVRLPDGRDVAVTSERDALEENIVSAFPDCADSAIRFVRELLAAEVNSESAEDALELLNRTSAEFRLFIDTQLQFRAQCAIDQCTAARAIAALRIAIGELWAIAGGVQSLADRLKDSFKQSGGTLRLNSPVLRLAYGSKGEPVGVDLLSGERVAATRAIVSNLTVWDTYGKLIGLSRTPKAISVALKETTARGVYQIFLGLDEAAAFRLPGNRIMLAAESVGESIAPQHLMLNVAAQNDGRAPQGKLAATLTAFTDADEWFAFHEDATWHEEQDQAALETLWGRLHAALPELGDGVEVIETATPQTYYETTRRKLGMIGSPQHHPDFAFHETPFPNLFLIGDTVSVGFGLESIARSALSLSQVLIE